MKKQNPFGALSCDGDTLAYTLRDMAWRIAIQDIRVIAEYVTAQGPFGDDYYFAFITSRERDGLHASFYASGRDAALALLEEKLSGSIEMGLRDFSDFKSRILWPNELKGHPLWETPPPQRGGLKSLQLTPAVKALLSK